MHFEVLAGYHDAALNSIELGTVPGDLLLCFRLEDGRNRKLTLHGCEMFRVTDFVLQNVVSRLIVVRGKTINATDVSNRLKWVSSLSDASSFLTSESLRSIAGKIEDAELTLLILEPSCGAELIVLFAVMEETENERKTGSVTALERKTGSERNTEKEK